MQANSKFIIQNSKFHVVLIIACVLLFPLTSAAQINKGERRAIKDKLFSDTLITSAGYKHNLEKSTKAYDSLRHSKSGFMRMLAGLLITSNKNSSDDAEPTPVLEVGRRYYLAFKGRKIAGINIVQANIFTRDTGKTTWAERFTNGLHKLTKKKEIERNLLFRVGDTIAPYTMAINEELLRSLPYLSTAYMVITPAPNAPGEVIVNIFARDSWTISADVRWGSEHYFSLFDRNFLGTGNELLVRYYLPIDEQLNGFEAQYNLTNLWGTFADVKLRAGVGATNNVLSITASRPFILPSDHIWGFTAGYEQRHQGMSTLDTTMLIKRIDFGAWYGYSVNIDPNQGTSFYSIVMADHVKFDKRPVVSNEINPYYYNRTTMLLSLGFARQNYFQGNMIYGYGRTEDVPFGYKFEMVGGLQWSEFVGRRYYAGATVAWGDLLGSSYLNIRLSAGTFFTTEGLPQQSAINVEANYFSPLFRLGHIYLRQFLYTTGTWGMHRLWGEKEQIGFNSTAKVRGMGNTNEQLGYNRFTIGMETVMFTPIFLYHFRFAFFVWGDVGFLGYDPNIFKGSVAAAAGIGVRIKNERLIFSNIQLRFGFSIARPDGINFNPFSLSNEQELRIRTFRPEVPQIIDYN